MRRILLDTSVLLWWTGMMPFEWEKQREAAELLRSPIHQKYVSAISMTEIAIKASLGKIEGDLYVLEKFLAQSPVLELPYQLSHAFEFARLSKVKDHKDPFDRMLIAQAVFEKLTFITSDEAIKKHYGRYADVMLLRR